MPYTHRQQYMRYQEDKWLTSTFGTCVKHCDRIKMHQKRFTTSYFLCCFLSSCTKVYFLGGYLGAVIKISSVYFCPTSSPSVCHATHWHPKGLTAVPQETFGTNVKNRPQMSRVKPTLELGIPLWTKHTAWPWQSGYCRLSPCAGCTPAASGTHSQWPRWTADPYGRRKKLSQMQLFKIIRDFLSGGHF